MKISLPILAGMAAALAPRPAGLLDAPDWWVVIGGGALLLLCLVGLVIIVLVGIATLRKK